MQIIVPGPPRSLGLLVGQVICYGVVSSFGAWKLWQGLRAGILPLKRGVVDASSPFFSGTGVIWGLVLLVAFMLWAEAIASLLTKQWRQREVPGKRRS